MDTARQSIAIANQRGLLLNLEQVDALTTLPATLEERLELARSLRPASSKRRRR